MNKWKEEYKKHIKETLKDIERNINDIVNIAFKNQTKEIHIKIDIEPDHLVTWSFEENIFTKPFQSVRKVELKEEGKKQ